MTKFDPKIHHRRSIRLQGYDYTEAGGYFVTIVTWHREFLFGKIVNKGMKLNQHGKIAEECWRSIPDHFQNVELGAYVVMPNHVHGIIVITDNRRGDVGARHAWPLQVRPRGVSSSSLGAIVGSFKSAVAKRIGRELNETGIWQRNYHEHVIRNANDVQNKTDYIEANPLLWGEDLENPINLK